MFGIISGIISGLFGMGKSYMEERKEVAVAKHKQTLRKIDADADWEATMAQGSMDSFKDEFWTIVIAIPLVLAFFPETSPFVENGFITLKKVVPDWYLYLLSVAFAAAFGVRSVIGSIKKFK